jgi:hypothetical protein
MGTRGDGVSSPALLLAPVSAKVIPSVPKYFPAMLAPISVAVARPLSYRKTRKTELNNSKTILADYIRYVKTEPLITEIDSNPFGVKTNLKKVLTDSLTHMAQAIG